MRRVWLCFCFVLCLVCGQRVEHSNVSLLKVTFTSIKLKATTMLKNIHLWNCIIISNIEIERNFVSHQNRIIGRWPNYVRKQQFSNHFYLLVVEVEASKNYHGIRAIIVQLHKFVQKNAWDMKRSTKFYEKSSSFSPCIKTHENRNHWTHCWRCSLSLFLLLSFFAGISSPINSTSLRVPTEKQFVIDGKSTEARKKNIDISQS